MPQDTTRLIQTIFPVESYHVFRIGKSLVNLTVDYLNIDGDVIKEAEWIKI